MRITVQAKPSARVAAIEAIGVATYRVSVTEPPVGGRANEAICRALAAHFAVPRSVVRIVSGYTMRQKVVEIIGAIGEN
jgi:uncharacterized protein YggU (UPF0235/DUF167 family)